MSCDEKRKHFSGYFEKRKKKEIEFYINLAIKKYKATNVILYFLEQ